MEWSPPKVVQVQMSLGEKAEMVQLNVRAMTIIDWA